MLRACEAITACSALGKTCVDAIAGVTDAVYNIVITMNVCLFMGAQLFLPAMKALLPLSRVPSGKTAIREASWNKSPESPFASVAALLVEVKRVYFTDVGVREVADEILKTVTAAIQSGKDKKKSAR